MAVSLKHAFVSSVPDGGDTSLVRPSNWNAEHDLTMAADRILGRVTSGTGAAEELTASQVKTLLAIASGDVSGLGSLATASGVTVSQISDATANGRSLISAANYAAMKALLDLEIGTDVQAYDAQLDSLSSASANGVSLVTAADYAAMKALLDLEIGTDVQAYYANLTTAGATTATIKTVGKETIWIPATAMIAATTNGAAAGSVETTTNKVMLKSLDFDTTTQEFAQFSIRMPKSWDEGTVTASFTWSHPSTTTNFGVVWALQAVALSNDDAGDTAFGTEQVIADTGGTTDDIYITSETPAVTIAGTPAAEDWVVFRVKRVPSNGSDTMAVDARLHGVTLYITTNAATDA